MSLFYQISTENVFVDIFGSVGCHWILHLTRLGHNIDAFDNFFYSDEAWFHLDGFINAQHYRIWSQENPYEYRESILHHQKIVVWCAMFCHRFIGPIFFEWRLMEKCTKTSLNSLPYWKKMNVITRSSKTMPMRTWLVRRLSFRVNSLASGSSVYYYGRPEVQTWHLLTFFTGVTSRIKFLSNHQQARSQTHI